METYSMLMTFSYIAGVREGNPTTAIERIEKYNR
jgi:hypothetical protein